MNVFSITLAPLFLVPPFTPFSHRPRGAYMKSSECCLMFGKGKVWVDVCMFKCHWLPLITLCVCVRASGVPKWRLIMITRRKERHTHTHRDIHYSVDHLIAYWMVVCNCMVEYFLHSLSHQVIRIEVNFQAQCLHLIHLQLGLKISLDLDYWLPSSSQATLNEGKGKKFIGLAPIDLFFMQLHSSSSLSHHHVIFIIISAQDQISDGDHDFLLASHQRLNVFRILWRTWAALVGT